jgi:TonB family protein
MKMFDCLLKTENKRNMIRRLLVTVVVALVSLSSLLAQSPTPVRRGTGPKAIFTPKPEYRPEWAKQGLTGKGVVLVTIDKQTGKVTGAQMLQSTGNKQLDGSALEAYSQWRFDPGTVIVPQLKIPIEFAKRPQAQASKRPQTHSKILYPLLILIGVGVGGLVMASMNKRKAM